MYKNEVFWWKLICNSDESVQTPVKIHALAVLILLLIVVALFWRVFFLGETLIDAATHSNQLPWGAATSAYNDYPYNRRDLTDTYVTRDYFVAQSYSNKELPLWNPYILGGHPIYADGVTKIFAPTHLLYLFFDVPLGYSLARLIELSLAAIFLYLFLINLNLNLGGAFTGSLVFLLSDHLMQHLTWSGWIGGLMWVPLILLGADNALKKDKMLPAVGSGVALALQFYLGYTPTAIYYLTALVFYYLLIPFLENFSINKARYIKSIKYLIVTLMVGMGLAAANWWPVFELLSFSNRKIVPTEIGYVWLPPWYLLTLILPRSFGKAFDASITKNFVDIGVSQDHIIYLGLVALILIIFIFLQKDWKNIDPKIYYFVFLSISALAIMTLAPIYVHITKYLPVLKTIRAVTRISGLYAFGCAVLAAYGANYLLKASWLELQSFLKKISFVFVVLFLFTFFGIFLFTFFGHVLPTDVTQLSGVKKLTIKILISLKETSQWNDSDALIPLIMIFFISIFTYFLSKKAEDKKILLFVVLFCLLVSELVWQGSQYNATFQRNLIYPQTDTIKFVQNNIGNYRVVVAPVELKEKAENIENNKIIAPPNTLLPYKINTIYGKDQLFPKWYREFTALSEKQNHLSHIVFSKTYSPIYDFLGVKYLMTKQDYVLTDGNYKEVHNSDGIKIYQNLTVKPRVFFAEKIENVSDKKDILSEMKKIDIASTVVLNENTLELTNIFPSESTDRIELTEYKNNKVTIKAQAFDTRLLVLTDTYYPGWEVFIDDKPAKLLQVNHAFRGVIVKGGEHKVEFIFCPKSFRYGVFVTCLSLVTTLFLVCISFYQRTSK